MPISCMPILHFSCRRGRTVRASDVLPHWKHQPHTASLCASRLASGGLLMLALTSGVKLKKRNIPLLRAPSTLCMLSIPAATLFTSE